MLILMKKDATKEDLLRVREKIETMGFRAHEIPGAQRTAIGITGNKGKISPEQFTTMSGVDDAILVSKPYKLAGRDANDSPRCKGVGGQIPSRRRVQAQELPLRVSGDEGGGTGTPQGSES